MERRRQLISLALVLLMGIANASAQGLFDANRKARQAFDAAYAAQKAGDLAEAIKGYKKTLELDSGLYAANNNLGFIYTKQGKHTLAAEQFLKAVKSAPGMPDHHANLAWITPRTLVNTSAPASARALLQAHVTEQTTSVRRRRWHPLATYPRTTRGAAPVPLC